jgi:hypothetical protein
MGAPSEYGTQLGLFSFCARYVPRAYERHSGRVHWVHVSPLNLDQSNASNASDIEPNLLFCGRPSPQS